MESSVKDRLKVIFAWGIGFILYMVAAMLTADVYGVPACFCQPAIAFVFGGIFVGLAYLLMLLTRRLHLDQYKPQIRIFNIILLVVGSILLLFSQRLGLTYPIYDSAIGEYFTGPNPIVVIIGYFMVIYSIINW
jgi:hypothetical protein